MTENSDYWVDEKCYLDDDDFRAYAARIAAIIDAHGADGVTIRRIHETLGDDARREWTLDAIDSLKHIDEVGVLVTRYRRTGGTAMSKTCREWKNYPDRRPGSLPLVLKQETLSL